MSPQPLSALAPRQTIDGKVITHFVELDARRSKSRSWSVCGELTDERDRSDQPTCPECMAYLDPGKTAEEMFGTEADMRAIGPPVRSARPQTTKAADGRCGPTRLRG